jgi:hypothetical protein
MAFEKADKELLRSLRQGSQFGGDLLRKHTRLLQQFDQLR